MRIGLHDSDKTKFPNYALMKISAWHKAQGDTVEWWLPMLEFDRVYSSKIFTFTPVEPMLPEDAILGGVGYGKYEELPEEIDRMFPDYSIYPDVDYAIGFLTRGCIRKCPWCIVPKKEGSIHPYRTWQEIKRPDSAKIRFMDNNVLASDYGIAQMESMIGTGVKVDFNQGLDARLVTPEIAEIISKLKWCAQIRFACDTDAVLDLVLEKITLLGKYGVKPYRIMCYVLTKEIESAERRCIALRSAGVDPYAQPYRDFENNIEPTHEQKRFARWVNNKYVFGRCKSFKEYDTSIKGAKR